MWIRIIIENIIVNIVGYLVNEFDSLLIKNPKICQENNCLQLPQHKLLGLGLECSCFLNFSSFFLSKKLLRLSPLSLNFFSKICHYSEEVSQRSDQIAENTVSIGCTKQKIALNTKLHERLQCVITRNVKNCEELQKTAPDKERSN